MSFSRIAASVLLASLILGAVGCGSGSPTTKPVSSPGEDPAMQHKNRIAALKARADELEKKLGDLKGRAEKATGDEKTKLQARVKDGTTALEAARKKVEELEKAGADGKYGELAITAHKEASAALESLAKAVE